MAQEIQEVRGLSSTSADLGAGAVGAGVGCRMWAPGVSGLMWERSRHLSLCLSLGLSSSPLLPVSEFGLWSLCSLMGGLPFIHVDTAHGTPEAHREFREQGSAWKPGLWKFKSGCLVNCSWWGQEGPWAGTGGWGQGARPNSYANENKFKSGKV